MKTRKVKAELPDRGRVIEYLGKLQTNTVKKKTVLVELHEKNVNSKVAMSKLDHLLTSW